MSDHRLVLDLWGLRVAASALRAGCEAFLAELDAGLAATAWGAADPAGAACPHDPEDREDRSTMDRPNDFRCARCGARGLGPAEE